MIGSQEKSMFEFGARQFQYLVFAALVALSVGPAAIAGQEQPAASQASVPPSQGVTPAAPMTQGVRPEESEAPQTLHLLVWPSIVISSPARIKSVSLADPSTAQAIWV